MSELFEANASPAHLAGPPDNFVPLHECRDIVTLRLLVKSLHRQLDDIDTLGDMLKPERSNYFRAVEASHRRRHDDVWTDGYNLWVPAMRVDDDGEVSR